MCRNSSAQLQSKLKPAFDVLDADGDGKISHQDLLQSFYADEALVSQMISYADSNKNGVVEYHEFEQMLGLAATTDQSGVMKDVFKVMDTDGDGKLTFSDLKSYLDSAGLIVSDEEIESMIRLGGEDEGGVSFDGLLTILAVNDF